MSDSCVLFPNHNLFFFSFLLNSYPLCVYILKKIFLFAKTLGPLNEEGRSKLIKTILAGISLRREQVPKGTQMLF